MQVERADPVGHKLEDESPQGQNLAQPGFGLRQPCPEGVKPKTDLPEVAIQLRERMVAKGPAKQFLQHHRGRAFKKVLLAADIEAHRIDVNDSRTMPQRSQRKLSSRIHDSRRTNRQEHIALLRSG